ncbi:MULTISPECIES: tRNA (adenosine(37)-N6)-dimethylallyltransferase MiaA [Agrobacterium]|uniref:tRNA (adenosine(37)-N6)-dimethylallyltransferase MiaA n=1 Tax=Agrobacterium TaxID=357 RepID=UPI000DD49075|nr:MULTISPECIES: tRNA (adenosine(37)-N6)-dimethylallyltransferase MiaA [Agrobacterium]MBO9109150.1 tRNA (adenosine(37)-N6)-dimethylallyltransferase MiaA [Agrobacterium sp. S2/73]NTA16259.1 tRNA (adenosine(37)-N6)-dimethylallyltransferase MiaA [Agrobacterium tumefaciens]NTA81257.1 tRNA (adenosine(37)-N6)-dimethylallyltransferase MiaA [Agrobacterium tumefaciens]QXZ73107.1 tRNA (adenosine(37)-N6)-dimethylallyltransferase MiaA [Agrobacterium sp. S7/73]WCK69827.1 tRNA (adenosine(37)-N6)-dimethylall
MMKNLDENFDAILITGPTASGKSALALRMARERNSVVINADSMQVYDTLRVLTARPSEEEMAGVPHLLYGHVPASSSYSTGEWLRDISALLGDLRRQQRFPVIVGGTGLYFKALTGGLSDMPDIPDDIRERLRARLIEEGSTVLHAELSRCDPLMARGLQPGDGQRIVRALEVMEATGKSIMEFQKASGPMIVDPDRAQKFVVLPERPVLHDRINRRFETMMESGAVEEVKALLAMNLAPDATAMKAIGVSQIADMLAGGMSEAEVIEKSAAATRQYAKRQMTWFRNQMGPDWARIQP